MSKDKVYQNRLAAGFKIMQYKIFLNVSITYTLIYKEIESYSVDFYTTALLEKRAANNFQVRFRQPKTSKRLRVSLLFLWNRCHGARVRVSSCHLVNCSPNCKGRSIRGSAKHLPFQLTWDLILSCKISFSIVLRLFFPSPEGKSHTCDGQKKDV